MRVVYGDLVELAKQGTWDCVTHSCNCFCKMKRGIAPQLAKAFGCDRYALEGAYYMGDYSKLGNIEWGDVVINSYMQYHWSDPGYHGIPFDYDACRLCLRKINKMFSGQSIGLPMIGCGLAKANPHVVVPIIKQELSSMEVDLVIHPNDRQKFAPIFQEIEKGAHYFNAQVPVKPN